MDGGKDGGGEEKREGERIEDREEAFKRESRFIYTYNPNRKGR